MLTPHLYRLTKKNLKNYCTDAINLRNIVLNEIEIEYTNNFLIFFKPGKASGKINLLEYCGELIIHKLSFAYTNVQLDNIKDSEASINVHNFSIKL